MTGKPHPGDKIVRWEIGDSPMWLNFADPTILNIHRDPSKPWPKEYVVVPEDYDQNKWIYLAITSKRFDKEIQKEKKFITLAHPVSGSSQGEFHTRSKILRTHQLMIFSDPPSRTRLCYTRPEQHDL